MKHTLLVSSIATFAVIGCGSDGAPTSGAAGVAGGSAGAIAAAGASSGSAGDVATGGGAGESAAGTGGDSTGGMAAASGGASGSSAGSGGSGSGGERPNTDGDGDYTIGPTLADSPDIAVKDVPHGTLFKLSMSSAKSIFTGLDKTLLAANQHAFTREVDVYVPKQYVDGTAAPIIVAQDGLQTDLVNALDNLIAEPDLAKRLPRIVTIFVANGGGDSKGSERGLEYDTVSDRYARFVQTEVLPAVKANAAIKAAYPKLAFTEDPAGRGTYGCSSGGEAAFTMGWFHPEWFQRIIAYSGTFVDLQDDDAPEEATYPLGAWEYHSKLIPAAAPKPLRVFLAVSEMDNHYTDPESSHFNWLFANQHMAAALAGKGYHYRFVYAKGTGHCDAKVRRATLPDTLRWMWRGYPLE